MRRMRGREGGREGGRKRERGGEGEWWGVLLSAIAASSFGSGRFSTSTCLSPSLTTSFGVPSTDIMIIGTNNFVVLFENFVLSRYLHITSDAKLKLP